MPVTDVGILLLFILEVFQLILVVRLVIEMIQSFSRSFRPPQWFYLLAEPLFLVTDPPVKLLRRLIPPLRTGGVALDISVLVLFLVLEVLRLVVRATFF